MNMMQERRLKSAIRSQTEVARLLGVCPTTVSKWESGASKPRADKLPEIAKLYGCTIDELFEGEPQK